MAQLAPESQRRTVPGCDLVVIQVPLVPQVLPLMHWKLKSVDWMGWLFIGLAVVPAEHSDVTPRTHANPKDRNAQDFRIWGISFVKNWPESKNDLVTLRKNSFLAVSRWDRNVKKDPYYVQLSLPVDRRQR